MLTKPCGDDHQVVAVVVQHPSFTLIVVRAAISSVRRRDKAGRYPRPATSVQFA
jgi:hypothetical protein